MMNWREMASRCREFPLDEVIARLGGEKDPQDSQKWDTPTGPIWLGKGKDRQKFFDHVTGTGGGGAIDLVMHIQRCDFKQAVSLLVHMLDPAESVYPRGVEKAAMSAGAAADGHFVRPAADIRHLPTVLNYLTQARGLPFSLVQKHIDTGQIYADARRNAVFVCDGASGETGAELRGTGKVPFKGMATGSKRGVGFFTLAHDNPTHLVAVESAIDALSYRALFQGTPATVISTAGVLPACPAIASLALVLGVSDIVIAYDNDLAGNEAADKLIEQLLVGTSLTLRHRTPPAKDWNEAFQQDSRLLGECVQ